ncbi:hypothetical protein V8E36_001685 [Tilletia maclaganii]
MIFSSQMLLAVTLALSVLSVSARDQSFPPCDTPSPFKKQHTKTGIAFPFEISDDPVFFVKPGKGACGITYSDSDLVACLAPGWINSAFHSKCGKKLAVADAQTGKQLVVKALDACGAVPGSTFGCNDIYLSKNAFEALGGSTQLGRLTSNVTWNFIQC